MIHYRKYIGVVLLLFATVALSSSDKEFTRLSQVKWRTVHLRAVKKVFDTSKPFLPPRLLVETGTGYYLGNGRILTDLELTRYAQNIDARLYDDSRVYKASIAWQGFDTGLALLEFKVPEIKKKDDITKEPIDEKKEEATKESNPEKESNKDKKRVLDLKLLKKSSTDIPFIETQDPLLIEDDSKNNYTNTSRTVDLKPLPFSMLSSLVGSNLEVTLLQDNGIGTNITVKFEREEFRPLENSVIDYHWLYTIKRLDQDLFPEFRGSPVLYKNKIIGIFHPLDYNTGYVIPAGVIRSFMDDIQDGRYDGLKLSGLMYRPIINPAQRNYLGLKENEGGLEVYRLTSASSAATTIHKGDIILAVDGINLDQDGFMFIDKQRWNVEEYFRSRMRVKKAIGLTVLRSNTRISLNMDVNESPRDHPGRLSLNGMRPWYLGCGLVFENLDYVQAMNQKNHNDPELYAKYLEMVQKDVWVGSGLIILSHRFASTHNVGASKFIHSIVETVNGRRVYGLEELANEWKRTRGEFVVITFSDRTDKLILPFSKTQIVNQQIESLYKLQENGRVH